jgi:YNFM family putative membrane transporter
MRRVRLGLFAAGLATFALLYTPQPLLPLLSGAFRVSPAAASLAMSAGTFALALAVIPVSSLSEVCGRRAVMIVSVLAAALLGLVAPLSASLPTLVALRVLQGFALAGVPATAMAYLTEEVDRSHLGRAMGLYIAGNAIGGLGGRVIAGVLADAAGWRVAAAGVAGLALACALAFTLLLPRSAHFSPSPPRLRALVRTLGRNLADTGLLRLYLIGFALMGAFVTVYNYLTFRLSAAPYGLSASVIGALFTVYLAGTWASTAAGRLADRAGRYRVLVAGVAVAVAGVALTLPGSLAVIVAGLVVMTAGFFAAHSVASGWVGARAPVAPAQASALYLCLYYLGSSVAGSAGGLFWSRGGWPAVTLFAVALLVVALAAALSLVTRRPAARPERGRDRLPGSEGGAGAGRHHQGHRGDRGRRD